MNAILLHALYDYVVQRESTTAEYVIYEIIKRV